MAKQYIVEAFSAGANQSIREFTLKDLKNVEIQNSQLAQRMAESFAQRMNQQEYLGFTDWQPRTRLIDTGLKTLNGV